MESFIDEIALDKKRRLALGRVVSIPAAELWIFQNPMVKKSLSRGLGQGPKHKLGSFAKFRTR